MADIKQIIDPKVIEELKSLNDELIRSGEIMDKLIPDFDKINKSSRKITKSNEEETQKRKQLTQTQDEALKKQKELEKAAEQLEKQRQKGLAQMAKIEAKERETRQELDKQVKSIEDARKQNIALRKVRSQLDLTTKEGLQTLKQYNETIDQNNDFIKENSDALTKQKINVGNYEESIQNALRGTELFSDGLQGTISRFISLSQEEGGVKGFFGSVVGGLKTATKAGLAFIATPIGAVIAAIVAGIALFTGAITRNQKASDTFNKIWSGITNVISEVTGRIFQLAGAVGELLKGNFKAFKTQAVGAFNGFGKAMKDAFEEGQNLRQLQIDLEKDTIRATTAIAKLSGEIRKQQIIADDSTRSFAEREAASELARKSEKKLAEQNLNLRNQELEIINKQVKQAERQGTINRELEQEQANALAARIEAENELTSVTLENEKTRSELKQDRLERDLDILIDGFDNVKTINERIIANERKTFAERQALLLKTSELGVQSFNKQIETIKQFTDIQFDANELLAEQDAELLNQRIRALGLSEIIEGRLLEIIRERRTAVQDLIDAQTGLVDSLINTDEITQAINDAEKERRKSDIEFLEEEFEKEKERSEERLRIQREIAEDNIELEKRKREAKLATLDVVKQVFGEETAIGRAATAIQQAEAIRQNLISLGVITAKNAEAQAKSAAAAPFPLNLPLIAGTIAQFIGIIKTFRNSQAKINAFAKGTDNAPGGLALVGEEGRELIQTPRGDVFLANNPSLVNLQRGSRVLSNARTEAYLNDGNIVNELRATRKAIQRIPQPVFLNGSKIAERRGNYWKNYKISKHRLN